MMCKACDKYLSDFELSRVEKETGIFIDLCNECYTESRSAEYVYTIDAEDLDIHETEGDSPWLK
jgi:protein-arginine kinase activator protein McsA